MEMTCLTSWVAREFGHPIPQDYLAFIAARSPADRSRAHLVMGNGNEYEASEWFAPADIPAIYRNCRAEGLIAERLLPILDSCGCVAALDCDESSSTYGCVLLQPPEGRYDEERQENVYAKPVLLARSFTELIARQVDAERLAALGLGPDA